MAGEIFDIRFQSTPNELAEPVRRTWAGLREEFLDGPKPTFRVDLTAHPELPVIVDAEGFPAVRAQARRAGLDAGGRVSLAGEPVRR